MITDTIEITEEEKKVVAALLGKLYISPASTEEKLRELYAEVSDAVETNLISDTTGRNALYKIHVSLGKIVNNLDQQKEAGFRRSTASRSVSLAPEPAAEDRTMVGQEPQIKEEEEDEDNESRLEADDSNDTVKPKSEDVGDGDSLVSELLDDDGDTIMS